MLAGEASPQTYILLLSLERDLYIQTQQREWTGVVERDSDKPPGLLEGLIKRVRIFPPIVYRKDKVLPRSDRLSWGETSQRQSRMGKRQLWV